MAGWAARTQVEVGALSDAIGASVPLRAQTYRGLIRAGWATDIWLLTRANEFLAALTYDEGKWRRIGMPDGRSSAGRPYGPGSLTWWDRAKGEEVSSGQRVYQLSAP
jgi:hypothetical protein